MKKVTYAIVAGLLLVLASGFSFTEISEYLQVARGKAKENIKSSIPTDVELDRLDLVLSKLDIKAEKQREKVAEAEVAFEKAKKSWEHEVARSEIYKQKMADLRQIQKSMTSSDSKLTLRVGCHTVSLQQIKVALAAELGKYKACRKVCAEKAKLMQAQEVSMNSLRLKLDEMNRQRDLLGQKLDLLRSRLEVQKATDAVNRDSKSEKSELQRAQELAEDIETRLEIREKTRSLENETTDQIIESALIEEDSFESEVDSTLNGENSRENNDT